MVRKPKYQQVFDAIKEAIREGRYESGQKLPSEAQLLDEFPEMVAKAASEAAPHDVAFYLRELAAQFHSYYNAERILVDDEDLRIARLALCAAVRQTLANGLSLLGVSAPEKM